MLRRGEIPRANAELYLVTVTPHESIALYRLPARRSSAQRHECSSKMARPALIRGLVRENAPEAGAKARALGLDRL